MSERDEQMPETLMIRATGLNDDLGGCGGRIFTTAGNGYPKTKYIRASRKAERERELVEMLKVARCPDCDGSGVIQYMSNDGPAIDQCQWCYERDEAIAKARDWQGGGDG